MSLFNSNQRQRSLRRHSMSILCVLSVLLFGCTSPSVSEEPRQGVTQFLLEKIGLKKPEPPSIATPAAKSRQIDLSIVAGANLNAGRSTQPTSVVMRIYHLRDQSSFEHLTLEDAQLSDHEKLNDSLIATHELTLVPGEQLRLNESVPIEASTLGVVALFHSPARFRWKFSFDTAAAAASGITIGVHACAMTISRGEPLRKDELRNDALLTRTRCEDE